MHDAWKLFTATCILHGSFKVKEMVDERDQAQMFRGVYLNDTMAAGRKNAEDEGGILFSSPDDFRLSSRDTAIKFRPMFNAPFNPVALSARRAGNHA
jgi:hypothetical protein